MPDATFSTLQGRSVHEHWTSAYRTPANEPFYNAAFDWIASLVPPGAKTLDAGCGSGTKTMHLARRGFQITAVDLSVPMLAEADHNVRAEVPGASVLFQHCDLTNLPFTSDSFALVVCWGVLMHVPSVESALSELCRVVAPGGILVLSENNQGAPEGRLLRTVRRLRGPQPGRSSQATPAGHLRTEDTPDGPMVTRLADPRWLIETCRKNGLTLHTRRAGELTQLYALKPVPALHRLNLAWFRHIRAAGPAFGNLFAFRK